MKTLRSITALLFGTALVSAQPAPMQGIPETLDLPTALRFAVENNFSIRQARERIKQQEGVVVEVRARAIPNVSAAGSYQLNDETLSQTFPTSDRAWNLSITASQTLFSGGGVRSAVKSSELSREAALLELKAVVNDALLDVRV